MTAILPVKILEGENSSAIQKWVKKGISLPVLGEWIADALNVLGMQQGNTFHMYYCVNLVMDFKIWLWKNHGKVMTFYFPLDVGTLSQGNEKSELSLISKSSLQLMNHSDRNIYL